LIRSFLAIELPETIREKIRELQRNLQDAGEETERTRQELEAKEAEAVRLNSVLKQKDDEIRATAQRRKAAEADHREKDQLVKERDKALKLVEERPVVEKIEKEYVNDYSAPSVLLIGLVIGLGTGAAIMYLLPFLANLFSS
jgi:signal transduction histidine kinase